MHNIITTENILLIGALLLFVAVMAGKAAYRFGAPALLFFCAATSPSMFSGCAAVRVAGLGTRRPCGHVALRGCARCFALFRHPGR